MNLIKHNLVNAKASDISNFLNVDLIGDDIEINSVSSIFSPKKNSLVFAIKPFDIEKNSSLLVLCKKDAYDKSNKSLFSSYILCPNPRLAFAKVLKKFFIYDHPPFIHDTAIISDSINIHPSVSIGANCFIGPGVHIGEGTVIKNNVVISENVHIGNFCYIKSGAVIGEEGFGFDFEEDRSPIRIPHIGSVVIGNHVEIGSNTVIARGTVSNTIIADKVKIDDLVFIAHNVIVKSKSIITACAEISGSVEIGENVWVGPNSSIMQKTKIGSNSTIGIGTAATSDVNPAQKIMGISGLPLRKLIKFLKMI